MPFEYGSISGNSGLSRLGEVSGMSANRSNASWLSLAVQVARDELHGDRAEVAENHAQRDPRRHVARARIRAGGDDVAGAKSTRPAHWLGGEPIGEPDEWTERVTVAVTTVTRENRAVGTRDSHQERFER